MATDATWLYCLQTVRANNALQPTFAGANAAELHTLDGGATRGRSAMPQDGAGHEFLEVDNVRITYVPARDRSPGANWSGSDVLRIQAYRNDSDSRCTWAPSCRYARPMHS